MKRQLHIAFLWHMHQPIYTAPGSSEAVMPWTRLHAMKDYLDMPLLCEETGFPATFNLVPSLIEQLQQYESGELTDRHLELSRKGVESLSSAEKATILSTFFAANEERMIARLPRYLELYRKYGKASEADYKELASLVSDRDILDLTTLFHLSWCGEHLRDEPVIASAISRGTDFSEDDRDKILDVTMEWIGRILPTYKRLWESGLIEITMSPFYHPILPLLCRTVAAVDARPDCDLPTLSITLPEDAKRQIDMGLAKFSEVFGRAPCGMWPSEGSVSEDVLPLLNGTPIRWLATDKAILMKSEADAATIYKPYSIERGGQRMSIVFRDHKLSDKVGFDYARIPARDAVTDFIADLTRIRESLPDDGDDYLVSVILDGENAWEFYPQNGQQFFLELYSRLKKEPWIEPTTIGRFIEEHPTQPALKRLGTGSWIDGDFGTWIGVEEKNRAWDLLIEARRMLQKVASVAEYSAVEKAMSHILIAEGSDWFWWFGEGDSPDLRRFDSLFRERIRAVYSSIGIDAPANLDEPIVKKHDGVRLVRRPLALISPNLDGKSTNYFEWQSAGECDRTGFLGAMHGGKTTFVMKRLFFGFGKENFYLRIDTNVGAKVEIESGISLVVEFSGDLRKRVTIERRKGGIETICSVFDPKNGVWGRIDAQVKISVEDVIELAIPKNLIDDGSESEVRFFAFAVKNGEIVERFPASGHIKIDIPGGDYESENWIV